MDLNGLQAQFQHLQRIQSAGGVRVTTAEGIRDTYEVMLFPPASEAVIASVEALLAGRVPRQLSAFWRLSNGANLFLNESGFHGVGVASTDLFIDLQQEEAEFYGAETMAGYAVVARVNGAGDFLVCETATGRILDGIHSEQPGEWRPIAASLEEWLGRLIEARGRYYWLEDLYAAA